MKVFETRNGIIPMALSSSCYSIFVGTLMWLVEMKEKNERLCNDQFRRCWLAKFCRGSRQMSAVQTNCVTEAIGIQQWQGWWGGFSCCTCERSRVTISLPSTNLPIGCGFCVFLLMVNVFFEELLSIDECFPLVLEFIFPFTFIERFEVVDREMEFDGVVR